MTHYKVQLLKVSVSGNANCTRLSIWFTVNFSSYIYPNVRFTSVQHRWKIHKY